MILLADRVTTERNRYRAALEKIADPATTDARLPIAREALKGGPGIGSPCPGCASLRRQCSELAGELGAAKAGNAEYRAELAKLREELRQMDEQARQAITAEATAVRRADAALVKARDMILVLERERDEHREQMAEVRRIAYQGGQDAASVRRELLAYLEGRNG